MAWVEYCAAFLAFFVSHSVPLRPENRARLIGILGSVGFTVCYSMLSILVLVWLIYAAGQVPFVVLWDWAPWQNRVTISAMVLACLLIGLALGRPNPLSFGGRRNEDFVPARAGVVGWVRHPFLAALLLWSAGHLTANGDLGHALLFGAFACFSLLGMRMVDRRKQRQFGVEAWQKLAACRPGFRASGSGALRICAGLLLLCGLYLAHGFVIGVVPTF